VDLAIQTLPRPTILFSSTTDAAGPCPAVTVLASSRYGQAAPLRLRLIALIYERLLAAGISLRES
jgi:hypothetical protein